jgi:hypothetical protein
MTPFQIRWTFPDKMPEGFFDLAQFERIKKLFFEDSGRRWQYVLRGWPARADGSELKLPDGLPFKYLALKVEFVTFKGELKGAVARTTSVKVIDVPNTSGFHFPYEATISIDLADVKALLSDRPRFKDTVTHEIGHALGIGMLLDPAQQGLIGDLTGKPIYVGQNAAGAYAAVLKEPIGTRHPIPIDRTGSYYHWSEKALPMEIMSKDLDPPRTKPLRKPTALGSRPNNMIGLGANVISAVSVGALKDLGYVVNTNAAEQFLVPPRQVDADGDHVGEAVSAPQPAASRDSAQRREQRNKLRR